MKEVTKESGKRKPRPEYAAWNDAKYRCYNPKHKAYKNYGGRGIVMCDEWKNNFSLFLEYIGNRPSKNHSLDRFPNNNGNYEPGNVRWATKLEQERNKQQTMMITINGETLCATDWAEKIGISDTGFKARIKRGVPLERCIDQNRILRSGPHAAKNLHHD